MNEVIDKLAAYARFNGSASALTDILDRGPAYETEKEHRLRVVGLLREAGARLEAELQEIQRSVSNG
jgi:hypothetical protein